ncbi:rolling circle replication-associated protein [Geobacillus stearothermophilus]|uniref:rolling circle replication-associated protein n=1 Tax=Geobacillus stearothermophilus TaxID=1422 RepID=UPI003D1DD2ED
MIYGAKVVMSGHVVEIYEYERDIKTGKDNKDGSKSVGRAGKGANEEDREKNREIVLSRAKREVRRLINSNVDAWDEKPKFFTLTFAENVTDIKWANNEFKKFRQRLSRHIWGCPNNLKYVAVIEFQKRGAVHYHVVAFNMPYVPHADLERIWGHGFVHIRAIDNCDNVGAYVTKYMTKDCDDERLREQKCYFSSRGLAKPVEEIIEKEDLDALRVALSPNKTFEKEFKSEYVGKVSYQQYNLKRRL